MNKHIDEHNRAMQDLTIEFWRFMVASSACIKRDPTLTPQERKAKLRQLKSDFDEIRANAKPL